MTFGQNVAAATIVATSFYVTFVNALGETVVVPGSILLEDVVTPDADPDTIDRATFTPALRQYACEPGNWPLLYGTSYRVRMTSRVRSADGLTSLVDGLSTTFTTGADPMLAAIRSEGVLTTGSADDRDLLAAGPIDEVPVSSTFTVAFSEEMTTAGANGIAGAGNIALWDTLDTASTADDVAVTSTLAALDDRTARLAPAALLRFARGYRLVVQGRDGADALEIQNAAGEPLDGTTEITFRTSPAVSFYFNPPGPPSGKEFHENSAISITFTRDMDPLSLADSTFVVQQRVLGSGVDCPKSGGTVTTRAGLISYSAATRTASFLGIPRYDGGGCVFANLSSAVRDTLGNPLVGGAVGNMNVTTGTDNSPNNVALTDPDDLDTGVPGDKVIRVAFGGFNDPIAPFSLKDPAVRLFNVSDGVAHPVRIAYDPVAVQLTMTPVALLDGSKQYRIEITDEVSDQALNSLSVAGGGPVFTVENAAPTLVAVTPTGAGVAVTTAIVATFSEPMRPTSFTAASFRTAAGAAPPVAATIALNPARTQATLTPTSPLAGNTAYTITLEGGIGGVADSAGNPIASTFAQSFTTESTAPRVTSLFPGEGSTPDVALTPAGAIVVQFSEPMDAGSLAAPSAIRVGYADACGVLHQVPGCLTLAAAGDAAFFRPSADAQPGDPLLGETLYGLALDSTVVTDLGGLALDLAASSPGGGCPTCPAVWPSSFTTVSANPVVLCALPADGATGVATTASIEIRFNEAVAPGTVGGAFTLYVRDTGATVAVGAPSFSAGGEVVTFTPAAALAPATAYLFVLADSVTDSGGMPLRAPFWSELTTRP